MSWNENLTNLNYILAGLYPFPQDSYRIVDEAGIPATFVAFHPRAVDNWNSILNEAVKRNKVEKLIKVAYKQYPDNPYLSLAIDGKLNFIQGSENFDWMASDDLTSSLEKIMGTQSTLMPINFLELGLERANSVAKIVVQRNGQAVLGTGFLISNNLLVTNNHVIQNETEALLTVIQFNHQKDSKGADLEPVVFELEPALGFATSQRHDWTAVKVKGEANSIWGSVSIDTEVSIESTDRVNIIQHPGGEQKQISIYHNMVTYADATRIQYFTDTVPGSSGSPVFDSQWNLVAVHHSGGHIREPSTKRIVFRNEGINIRCILQGLQENNML